MILKTLIIAPTRPALTKGPDEVAYIASKIPSVILQGDDVTEDRIAEAIGTHGSFEGFWFTTDGSKDGAVLSNGTMITPYAIAALLRIAEAEWVVFNICDSRELVSTIQLLAPVDVVATEAGQIEDVEAWHFAKRLAVEFSRSGSMRQAVSKAAPGSAVHRFYQNERNMVRQYASTKPTIPTVIQSDQTEREMLQLLMGWVDGDRRRGVRGLRETSDEILKQMEKAKEERDSLAAKLSAAQTFLIIEGAGVIAAIVSIIWLFASGPR